MTYRTSSLVSNICVHATSQAKQPIAIVFPHAANLKSAVRAASPASGNGPSLPDPESDVHLLCSSPAVQDLLLKDLQALAKKTGLKGIEVVQGVVLTPDEWTPEVGLLTAAQKVQRKAVERAFRDQISVRPMFSLQNSLCSSNDGLICYLTGVLRGESRLDVCLVRRNGHELAEIRL
jgi:long-chain acyl-CoA synthetase